MHAQEDVEMGWWTMSQTIGALCMEEEINGDGDEIWDIHGEIPSLEKDEIL